MPQTPAPYQLVNAFGTLTFSAPVAIVSPPGETNRVFIVEQTGRIAVVTNLASPNRTTFLTLTNRVRFGGEQGLLGLAFHPNYANNRRFFVTYTYPPGTGLRYDRLSRFETSPTDPNVGLPDSEVVLIEQLDDFSNHNSGDLHFGPDGYLYGTLGDEGDANDTGQNSQRIDKDFFSAIFRIDVDMRPGSLTPNPHPANTNNPTMSFNYAIPADNPFVGATSFNGIAVNPNNVRTEFWAVGLRNAWRFSFDPVTGLLWLADVGQGTREEVDIITKGGNYGWNYREGLIARPGSPAPPPGFTHINPIQDYGHGTATNQGNSITGGVVYRGDPLSPLYGAYIFADYDSGHIWQMRYEVNGSVTNITPFSWMLTDSGIAAFGVDPSNGDILVSDVVEGRIKRLSGLPTTLAQTGIFSDMVNLTPNAGILPYDVNVPVWSDGAQISRWFYLPLANRITFRATNTWTIPTEGVWVQHLDMEMTNGVPESRRRIETRVLVRSSASPAPADYGVSYRWTSPSNAVLVSSNGMQEALTVYNGGAPTTVTWQYPRRSDCLVCHNTTSGRILGFNTPQLNRNHDYNGIVDNQIRALNNAGFFLSAATNLNSLPRLASLTDEASSAEYRARSYLMANCAHCHYPGGPGMGNYDARIYRLLSTVNILNGNLINNLGNTANRVVVPGSLANSVMYTRMSSTDPAIRMPDQGSVIPDQQALAVFRQWIDGELQDFQTFAEWQINYFGGTNVPNGGASGDFDGDGAKNFLEYLTESNPTNALDSWQGVGIERGDNSVNILIPQIANRGFEVQWTTNLQATSLWRFLDVPENVPQYSVSNRTHRVPDAVGANPKFYRVRVYDH